MRLIRGAAAATVSVTGLALLVPTVGRLLTPGEPALGLLLAGLGALTSLVVVLAGIGLYLSDIETENALRIAGWNLLGVVVLGSVLVLASFYVSTPVPTFLVADVLAVSAFAHVLIGFNDVRRIRAEEVADKTEKLDVLNRLLRHNLRTEVQAITGYADLIRDAVADDSTLAAHAGTIQARTRRLNRMNENVKHIFWALETRSYELVEVSVVDSLDPILDSVAEAHPDVDLRRDLPADLSVAAGDRLGVALTHLVENAVEHNDDPEPTVRVEASEDDEWVDITVADNGPGIPEMERSVVTGESEITQLNHSQGLGLWVVKWIANVYGGSVAFDAGTDGSTARVRLRRAG